MPYKQGWETLVNNPLFHHRNNNIQQATLHSGVACFFLYHPRYIFPQKLGSYEEKSYLCKRKAALGKLKASFLCARLHFLCRRKAALGKLKASFLCARLHFLCHRIALKKKLWDIKKIL